MGSSWADGKRTAAYVGYATLHRYPDFGQGVAEGVRSSFDAFGRVGDTPTRMVARDFGGGGADTQANPYVFERTDNPPTAGAVGREQGRCLHGFLRQEQTPPVSEAPVN